MKKTVLINIMLLLVFCVFAYSTQELCDAVSLNNATVKTAAEEVTKALLDCKDAKAGLAPKIDLTITGSYLCNPIKPIRLNLGDYVAEPSFLNAYGSDYITIYEGQENTYYQFSLSATQPLFTWGKLLNSIKIYDDVYKIRQLQLEEETNKAVTEVKTRLAAVFYLNKIADILGEQKQISDRLVALSDSAFESGMMLETDALGVKVKASQIDVASAQIKQQLIQMKTALKNLTGLDVDVHDVQFDEQLMVAKAEQFGESDFSKLLDEALSVSRPTFRMLNLFREVSEKTEKIASVSQNWIPDLALVVNANYQGARLPLFETDWYGKDDWDATVTIALKTTLFDGGTATRAYKKSKADTEKAIINIDDAKSQISTAVTENYSAIGVDLAKIEYQNAMISQLDSQIGVKKNLYETGYGSESDYLQLVMEKNNTLIESLQIKIELATAVQTLCFLIGEDL